MCCRSCGTIDVGKDVYMWQVKEYMELWQSWGGNSWIKNRDRKMMWFEEEGEITQAEYAARGWRWGAFSAMLWGRCWRGIYLREWVEGFQETSNRLKQWCWTVLAELGECWRKCGSKDWVITKVIYMMLFLFSRYCFSTCVKLHSFSNCIAWHWAMP